MNIARPARTDSLLISVQDIHICFLFNDKTAFKNMKTQMMSSCQKTRLYKTECTQQLRLQVTHTFVAPVGKNKQIMHQTVLPSFLLLIRNLIHSKKENHFSSILGMKVLFVLFCGIQCSHHCFGYASLWPVCLVFPQNPLNRGQTGHFLSLVLCSHGGDDSMPHGRW